MNRFLSKQANQEDERSLGDRAALGVGGLAAIGASKDYVSGRKTLYHGTSKKNAERIKEEGLLTAKGGSGAAKGTERFEGASGGQVHATSMKPYAKFYANLADEKKGMGADFQKIMGESTPEEYDQAVKRQGVNTVTSFFTNNKKESEVLKVNMPYADYNKQFTLDDDGGPVRYMAGKSNQDVDSKYIKGGANNAGLMSQLRETAVGLPEYVKKHPARFGSGLGLATLGGAGVYQSMKTEKGGQ